MICKKCEKGEIQETIVEIDRKYHTFFGCDKCENGWVVEDQSQFKTRKEMIMAETQNITEIQNKIILDAIRYYKEFIKNDDVIREYGFDDIIQLENFLENK
jgi:hypothetical protein